jgi:hypothetical protein
MILIIHLLAFCGGFTIMSFELLGGRILAPYFGSGVYVWGSIITIFMMSLAIGYLLGGRLSVVNPTPKKFATIFAAGAIFLYPMILYAQPVMEFIFLRIEDPRYGSLATAAFLFMLPTIILGMISPYSVRLLVENVEESGKVAGALYFTSTLGSAIGTLVTSFYLVLWFEVNSIITILTLILLGIAVIAWFFAPGQQSTMDKNSDASG